MAKIWKIERVYPATALHIWVAPESWDPLYPRAFGIFFLCRTLAKNAEIADFWKHLVIFAWKKHPKIGGFWTPKLGPLKNGQNIFNRRPKLMENWAKFPYVRYFLVCQTNIWQCQFAPKFDTENVVPNFWERITIYRMYGTFPALKSSMKFVLSPDGILQSLPNISCLWFLLHTTILVCWRFVGKILPATCSHINILEWAKFGWQNFAL